MNKIMEIWKSIEGFEGLYEVSNYGRVKSLPRPCPGREWPIRGQVMTPVLRGGRKSRKYYYVSLAKPPIKKSEAVHRLVAKAFISNPQSKPEVNHKDGDKSNNNHKNLEWSTRKENVEHSSKNGLLWKNGIHSNAKLTLKKVKEIKAELTKGKRQCDIARKHNIDHRHIQSISCGRTWKHVTI